MVRQIQYIILFISILLCVSGAVSAQEVDAFARISVSPRQGVVRQPYKVNISVYSSTWFTQGLQFSNLHIDDAFIIPFTRTVSSLTYIKKKKYATLTFYYLVFPYNSGNLVIPEITMSTSIPPEGGYEGIPTTIKTKPQTIKVTPIPEGEKPVWLVAKSAYISEKWNKPTTSLKVGDVIQRTITIRANGTLPSLISPLEIDDTKNVSIYPSAPILQDKRNDDDINGVRIESYSYLFEKEGDIIIPSEELVWWNPYAKRTYKRILPERTITILPNPDLALLQSIKDSLDTINMPEKGELSDTTFPWKRTLILSIIILSSLWIVYRMTKKELHRALKRRETYLQSEAYHFNRLKKAAKSGNTAVYIREFYIWFDKVRDEEVSLSSILQDEDKVIFIEIMQSTLDSSKNSHSKKELLSLANNTRKRFSKNKKQALKNNLNP